LLTEKSSDLAHHDFSTSFIWGYLHIIRELWPAGKNNPLNPQSLKGSKKPGPNRVNADSSPLA